MANRTPNLFDEFDKLAAEFDAVINGMDEPTIKVGDPLAVKSHYPLPNLKSRDAMRPNLPDHTDPNFIWQRPTVIKKDYAATLTINGFFSLLTWNASKFVWNDTTEGKYLRGWSKEGYTFDPVTAVVLAELGEHFSLCVTDIAGMRLGLSYQDADLLAQVCWTVNPVVLEWNPQVKEMRYQMIAAIEARNSIDPTKKP